MNKTRPSLVMIGGTGRSGSNLLKAVLSQAPGVTSLPFETRFGVDPDGVLPTFRALLSPVTPFQSHRLVARMAKLLRSVAQRSLADSVAIKMDIGARKLGAQALNLRPYKEWELERHAPGFGKAVEVLLGEITIGEYRGIWPGRTGWGRLPVNHIIETDPERLTQAFSKFFATIHSAICEKSGASVYVADETYSLFHASKTEMLCPGAMFIHVVRDPRDVVASLMRQRWAPSDPEMAVQFYVSSIRPILADLARLEDRNALVTVRLEDIVDHPADELAKLCQATGLTFDDAMVRQDFSRENRGQWRTQIPSSARRMLNTTLADQIRHFGYDPA